jgi:hypothetical protein
MTFTIEPIVPSAKQSGVDFGAIINDLDLEKITRMCLFFIYTMRKREKERKRERAALAD